MPPPRTPAGFVRVEQRRRINGTRTRTDPYIGLQKRARAGEEVRRSGPAFRPGWHGWMRQVRPLQRQLRSSLALPACFFGVGLAFGLLLGQYLPRAHHL